MKDDMPRFEFHHTSPDAYIVLFIVMTAMVVAFIGLVALQDRADREEAERFRDPYRNLDKQVKLQLMRADPELYGKRFKDVE